MPNILLETMAAGLPVACSNCGPMPEVLGDAGVYFDPENSQEIALAIKQYLLSPELREDNARKSFELSQQYSWANCAEQTMAFLAETARAYRS
jgi:glycosyltransferase involved in cell wall biosynthesis